MPVASSPNKSLPFGSASYQRLENVDDLFVKCTVAVLVVLDTRNDVFDFAVRFNRQSVMNRAFYNTRVIQFSFIELSLSSSCRRHRRYRFILRLLLLSPLLP